MNRKGIKRSIPEFQGREWETFIPGNGWEREFSLTLSQEIPPDSRQSFMFFWTPGICGTWRRRRSWLFQLCPSPRPRPRCQRCCWEEETFLIFFLKKDICPWLPDWKIRRPLPPEEVKEWKTSQHPASSSPISFFSQLARLYRLTVQCQSHSFKATFWKSHISKNLPRPQVDTGAQIATNWRKKFGMSTNKSSAKERTKTLGVIFFR